MQVNNFGATVQSLKSESQETSSIAQAKLNKSEQETRTPFGQQVSDAAQARNTERKADANQVDNPLDQATPADVQRDQQIIDATLSSVEISSAKRPEQLTLKVVIEEINLALEPDLGPRAIQTGLATGLDVSPEATAQRIVSMSTAMFSAFSDANTDLNGEELVNRFVEVIGSGIKTGFEQARTILEGLNVLNGDIATNVDATFELVEQKLEAFRQSYLPDSSESLDGASGEPSGETSSDG